MSFAQQIPQYRDRVNAALEYWLSSPEIEPTRLHQALRYAVLGPGKRVRPLLVYATGELIGVEPRQLDPIAVAVELVHSYSLVHDDLPAMDDDELRRGRPATHVAFDEATAILVGDALQSLAFHVLATDPAYEDMPEVSVGLIATLAEASGSTGMAGGQIMDLAAEGAQLAPPELEDIYARKTGSLIHASIVMPCHCQPDQPDNRFDHLERFARDVGLAFQVVDDVLDVEGSTDVIGKDQGSDIKNRKATYPSIVGLNKAKSRADDLYHDAMSRLDGIGAGTESLRWLSDFIVQRNH